MCSGLEEAKYLLHRHKVLIFSISDCPNSKLTKEAFEKIGQEYTAIETDLDENGLGHLAMLSLLHGVKLTVPAVFVNSNYLGGGSHVKVLFEKGELQSAVETLLT